MAIFTVHAPPAGATSPMPEPERLAFVKEGFCWPALFFAVPWLLVRRLWLVLIGYLLVGVALSFLGDRTGSPVFSVLAILFAFWFALEANELRRWTLARNGWRFLGVVEGRRRDEAERRFFAEEGRAAPAAVTPAAPPARTGQPARAEEGVIGLFPAPGAGAA